LCEGRGRDEYNKQRKNKDPKSTKILTHGPIAETIHNQKSEGERFIRFVKI